LATVFDVAQYILAKYTGMDAMKLQKLVFYSQAWRVVQSGSTLFDEPVKAYEKGPVVGRLFYRHKGRRYVTGEVVGVGSKDAISQPEAALIDCVLEKYGSMTAEELSELTHSETPWMQAWELRDWDDVIHPTAMKQYYSTRLAYEPTLAPTLQDMCVTYVRRDDLDGVLDSLDEPDDISGFLKQIGKARARLHA
jgi:uncharacterized phage-associated protein